MKLQWSRKVAKHQMPGKRIAIHIVKKTGGRAVIAVMQPRVSQLKNGRAYFVFLGLSGTMKSTLVVETTDELVIQDLIRKCLKPKSFLGFQGQMGAGKTTLISKLFKDQNINVSSPTFALYNVYPAFGTDVVHVDLYRLKNADEVESSGFWDLFGNSDSMILTEWVDRINLWDIPLEWDIWLVTIKVSSDDVRTISLAQLTH